jgi:hypothetical protein
MVAYDFSLILKQPSEFTDELAGKLFAAGSGDVTPSSSNGVVSVDFSREAKDLESAIRSAVAGTSAAAAL